MTVPVVGRPGELAAMSSEESEPGMRAIAGATWKNEIVASGALAERTEQADQADGAGFSCPLLVLIADRDTITPPRRRARPPGGRRAMSRFGSIPCEHFDIYLDWSERAIADQLHFLRRHLDGAGDRPRGSAALSSEK